MKIPPPNDFVEFVSMMICIFVGVALGLAIVCAGAGLLIDSIK